MEPKGTSPGSGRKREENSTWNIDPFVAKARKRPTSDIPRGGEKEPRSRMAVLGPSRDDAKEKKRDCEKKIGMTACVNLMQALI